MSAARPAVFLDRDGTLIEERGYHRSPRAARGLSLDADALRLLKRAGFAMVVITNQSAIGRGIIDEPFLQTVHATLDRQLARAGAQVDRYYFCPHHPDAHAARATAWRAGAASRGPA